MQTAPENGRNGGPPAMHMPPIVSPQAWEAARGVTVTGFETAEVDLLIQDLNEAAPDEADEVPEVDRSMPAVSRRGNLWRIGDHLLLRRCLG